MTDDRLKELEAYTWTLLIHDAAAAQREGLPLCAEAERILDYFVEHGVELLDEDGDELVRRRVHPSNSLYGNLFVAVTA